MPIYATDGDFVTATMFGPARTSFPIERDNTAKIIEQDFMQNFDDFVPLALNTPHPEIAGAYLIAEMPLEDMGAGVAKWTRRYATVPATLSDYASFAYLFPGYLGVGNPPYSQYYFADPIGRDRQDETVQSRLENKYFLVGSGGTYADVPAMMAAQGVDAQKYAVTTNADARIDYLFDETSPGDPESTPSLTDYKAMVTAGDEIVAEQSFPEQYAGNIWRVITRYVVAQ